jgi:hypothetical protein
MTDSWHLTDSKIPQGEPVDLNSALQVGVPEYTFLVERPRHGKPICLEFLRNPSKFARGSEPISDEQEHQRECIFLVDILCFRVLEWGGDGESFPS